MISHTQLFTLQQQLEQQHELSQESRAWLLEGIEAFTESGGKISLCRCLGLRGPGVRSLETELARTERNIALRHAFEAMERIKPDESDTAALKRFETLVKRFSAVTWLRHRHLDEPPCHFDEVRRSLFDAFRHGRSCGGVPCSDRQLRGIVLS